jgi:hypothetical protein
MRPNYFIKVLSTAALIVPLFAGPGVTASPQSIHQNCNGILTRDEDGYQLRPDAGSGLWCDSYIAGELVQRVLKACAVGSRCHIKGSVRGHGVFYWLQISTVAALPPGTSIRWTDPGALRAFVGKYAFDHVNGRKLVEVPEVRSRIQMLLGATVPNLINEWDVSSPFEEHAGWLVAAGCRPHMCRDNQWVIAINLSDHNVFICFAEEKKPVKYGATGKTVIELKPPNDTSNPCPDEENALPVFQRIFSMPVQSAQENPIQPSPKPITCVGLFNTYATRNGQVISYRT